MRSINIIILIIMKNKNVYPWIVVALLWVYNPQNHPNNFSKRNGSVFFGLSKRNGSV